MLKANMKESNGAKLLDENLQTWVLIFKDDLLNANNAEGATPDMVQLKHPRTGLGTMFLFSPDNSVVQEVLLFSEKRSWFINNSVRENGKLLLSTPVDPLFLILPYLRQSQMENKVVPMDDLLLDSSFPEAYRLVKSASNYIHQIADRKGPEDLNAWKYNEDKTLKWLTKKVEKVTNFLKEKRIDVKGGATSKNFVKSTLENSFDLDHEFYLKYAHGLVSEYLEDDLSLKLSSSLGLPIESPEKKQTNKRKSSQTEEFEENKKFKINEEEKEVFMEKIKQEKPKSMTAKEKAMKKAATGSKAITSFFTKK